MTMRCMHHNIFFFIFFSDEKQCSIHGSGESWNAQESRVVGATELNPDVEIKIIRKGAIRYN